MPTKVIMPKVGLTVTEGTLVKWLVGEGTAVSKGQPLAELESDKAVFQVEAPADGIMARIVVPEGETVEMAEVIAWITAPGEDLGSLDPPPGSGDAAETARKAAGKTDDGSPPAREGPITGRMKVSPAARKTAEEAGLDLSKVHGTGPGGRVVLADVEAALAERGAPVAAPTSGQGRDTNGAGDEIVPVAGIRAVIARRMSESHQTAARVTLTAEVDATEFVRLRERLNVEAQTRGVTSVSYTDLLVKVAALALREHPGMNTRLVGSEIHRLSDINIGIAVDTDRGLLVPVVRDAAQKSVLQIASDSMALVQRAQSGRYLPDDSAGGTFTITNLGMYGVEAFTPIINLPQCAILGAGRIKRKPVVVGDEIVIRPMVWLSLAFDHRLTDGAPAARFLQYVRRLVEDPYLLVL